MAMLNDDVNQLERFLDSGAHEIIITAANVVFVGIVFAVISPIADVCSRSCRSRSSSSVRCAIRSRSRSATTPCAPPRATIADTLTNNLGGIATIKAFNAEEREVDRVAADSLAYAAANAEAIRYSSAFVPLIRMAILAGFTMTLVVGGRAALRHDLELGSFSVLVYMTQRLLWPLTRLGETLDLYQRAMASCRRIFGLLDVRTVDPARHPRSAPTGAGRGAFRATCGFAYGDRRRRAARPQPRRPGRGDPRHRRGHRLGQVHHREAAAASLRTRQRLDRCRRTCRSTS